MKYTKSFPHAPESVPAARLFVRQVLKELPDEVRETMALLITELASNCIRHTDREFELTITRAAGEIRVEATDCGEGKPTMRAPGPTDPNGRGLQIVDMLASSWGFDRLPDGGKTVWFVLASEAPAGAEACPA